MSLSGNHLWLGPFDWFGPRHRRRNKKPPAGRSARSPADPASPRISARGPARAPAESPPVSWPKEWLPGLLLVALVVLAYAPAWSGGFIWDDDFYVTHNPLLTAPDGLRRIWFSLDSPSQYFPLTYTSFRLERALWGLNPAGYHVVNILLHALNALLVWRVLKQLAVPGAWLAAALFALHPVQVESVAWITERKNLLSLFFALLAVRAWIEFIADQSPSAWKYYGLALAAAGLALCAKTTACTLPVALIVVLLLQGRALTPRRLVQLAPFAVLGLAMGLVSVWWERYHQGTSGALFAFGPVDRLLIASHAVWFYLGKLAWPAHLMFSYPRWSIDAHDPRTCGWLIACGLACVAVWCARRRGGRAVGLAALFFVVTLSPVLGFIMNYTFRYTFVADHYQYVACLGPLTLAAAALERGLVRLAEVGRVLRPMMFAAVLTVLGALTWQQCRIYASEETLWRATIAQNPGSWMAHDNLATTLDLAGKLDDAMIQYQESLRLYPDHVETRNNFGAALERQGRLDEAVAQFQIALQVDPGNVEARNNLGDALLEMRRPQAAISQYQEALRRKPGSATAQFGLANALRQTGNLDAAMSHYQAALNLRPDYPEAGNNLGALLDQMGKVDAAIAQYQQTVQASPDYAEARLNLGSDLMRTGRLDAAIAQYQTALKIRPDYVEAHNNLGNAFLKTHRLEEALAQFQSARQIDPSSAAAQFGLGNVLRQMGREGEAAGFYRQALQLQPHDPAIENNLAWLLASASDPAARDGGQAVALARDAGARSGGANPLILRTLAAALAETGQFAGAAETARQALAQAQAQSNAWLTAVLPREIKLYQSGQPVRDPASKH